MQLRRIRSAAVSKYALVFAFIMLIPLGAKCKPDRLTTVRVHVTDAETGNPVFQAHITLEFRQPGGLLRRSKKISYSAKTDKQGMCKLPYVSEGTVTLVVIAPDHQTFGKEINIKEDNQLIEVKLKKPMPVL